MVPFFSSILKALCNKKIYVRYLKWNGIYLGKYYILRRVLTREVGDEKIRYINSLLKTHIFTCFGTEFIECMQTSNIQRTDEVVA